MEPLSVGLAGIPRLVPYAAGGDLAYGGRLHGLLAGSMYAGTLRALGACVTDCGDALLLARCGRDEPIELYYVAPDALRVLDERLSGLGAMRRTIVLRHGGLVVHAETHLVNGCRPAAARSQWVRLLLVLPPEAPPPATPMAVYTAVLSNLSPCDNGQAFCEKEGGAEAAVADLLVSEKVLSSWLEGLGARLLETSAQLSHNSLVAYVHVPVKLGGSGD